MKYRDRSRAARCLRALALTALLILATGCETKAPTPENGPTAGSDSVPESRPAILLVTLDTTRADRLGFAGGGAQTPHLDALAATGRRFSQAYSTAPMTLPSHASIFTGRYPAEHGVHENARHLNTDHPLLAEHLSRAGYRTAAVVSGFPLSRQFGLARGFDHYDDQLPPGKLERKAEATTDRALDILRQTPHAPLFLWVHYFDPHEPYEPPEPFRSRHDAPYLGEIAYMDHELGRLLDAFQQLYGQQEHRVLVAGDHGEGRGDHGEALHGNLLYQGVMRVPLLVAGSGIEPGEESRPVSLRRIFGTILAWATSRKSTNQGATLFGGQPEVVLAEAMKPHLQYGWQPQVMAVFGRHKIIRSGEIEVYDVVADPEEKRNLEGQVELGREVRQALRDYPLPAANEAVDDRLSSEDRAKLASLGYSGGQSGSAPRRENAPSPRRMTRLLANLDVASGLFTDQRYAEAILLFEKILARDPENFVVHLRFAVALSILGHEERAIKAFAKARVLNPHSVDLRHYQALHHLRFGQSELAAPLLESVLVANPRRLPTLEAIARIREGQRDFAGACRHLEKVVKLHPEPADTWLRLGQLRMAQQQTDAAIEAFEQARERYGLDFPASLELGVLYLANHNLAKARDALDRVPPSHPSYPMALFKRAQVAALLNEPDRQDRIQAAQTHADTTTRPLIAQEQLFR